MSLLHSLPVALVEQPVAFNQDLKALVPQSDVNSEFILRWLQVAQAPILLLTSEATHGTKRLPTGDLLATKIAVPSFDEQRSIADALVDVDALIEALEKLIVKKRAIKQATQQQLLTGKTRLPGFTVKWKTTRLGDISTCLPTANNPRADLNEHAEVEYIHYGDVHSHAQPVMDCARANLPRIDKNRIGNATRLQDGDLVMVDASEDLVGVCKSIEVIGIAGRTIVAGLHTILLRGNPAHWASGFKAYLQSIPAFKSALTRMATGISVYAVSAKQVADVEIPLPSVPEQVRIATVLDGRRPARESRFAMDRFLAPSPSLIA